jgi:hypothetical protein
VLSKSCIFSYTGNNLKIFQDKTIWEVSAFSIPVLPTVSFDFKVKIIYIKYYTTGTGDFPLGVKQQGCEADHSPSSTEEVKDGGVICPLPHTSSFHDAKGTP